MSVKDLQYPWHFFIVTFICFGQDVCIWCKLNLASVILGAQSGRMLRKVSVIAILQES